MHACGAPLADGLLVGNALRCPWHHACFSLRTGKNLRPPAPNPISCWRVEQRDGSRHAYDALFLATGTEPIGLTVAGGNLRHAHYWRTLADSRAVVSKAPASRRAIVIGASFIGLEAAASLEVATSLRAREVGTRVVAPETVPVEKILGADVGTFIRELHERNGVGFRLGTTVIPIDKHSVRLENGETLQADLVVVGIGVRPMIALAEQLGLATDRGIAVDEYLETNIPRIFAAGDIARWPGRLTGEHIRVEHRVVTERPGQTAARTMPGRREPFAAAPFLWTEQYDFRLAYVGHAERWDRAKIGGKLDPETQDCAITCRRNGKALTMAFMHGDLEGLRAEVEFEKTIATPEQPCLALHRAAAGAISKDAHRDREIQSR